MKSTIRLFKALPIYSREIIKSDISILEETIKKGFIFTPILISNYSTKELIGFIKIIEEEIGLTAEKINSSFHKSWQKIKETDIIQLVVEQLIHYFTTYGFERLGIYDKDSVYIPKEKLEIPELKEGIRLTIIRGYTKKELKEKLLNLLQSGIALSEDTINDIIDVALFVELNEQEIETIKNKETKVRLYDYLDKFPENPVEFLRFLVYKSINKTLLIKNEATITEIKAKDNLYILNLLNRYKSKYGLGKLSEIFYRFRPLWLAFRTNSGLKSAINRIRKLAKKYHKPMKEDYLNEITAKIKNDEKIDNDKLKSELKNVNIFRKIRLLYALKYRTKDVDSILYRIRNGKSYATNFSFEQKNTANRIFQIILNSVIKDISKNAKNKKIYIPNYITYALPATEKQFTDNFPSGTYINIPKDMIIGIHWENINNHRIDLDLSMISPETGKIGWDAGYRTDDRSILFSGDMTDAQTPLGASELFYVKRQIKNAFIVFVNYYNFDSDIGEVPFKIIVAKEQVGNLKENYMVNPNNIISIAKSKINQKQKILGLLIITTNNCRFYFVETYLGMSITATGNEFVENARKYLFNFYENAISLNKILKDAGAIIIGDKNEADIDLSPEIIEKDNILSLIK